VNAAAAGDTTHVVELRRSEGLSHLPFTRELTDMRFGLFVDVESAEITTSRRFVERNIGCSTMLPVFGKSA
jgi:hypothetical protein